MLNNQANPTQPALSSSEKTKHMTRVGILCAAAIILYFFEIAIPIFPQFLKYDLSDIPAIVGTLTLGPVAGIIIEAIKNLVHLTVSGSAFVGELTNACVGTVYILGIWFSYNAFKKFKFARVMSFVIGGLLMTIFAGFFNYLVAIPLYGKLLHFTAQMIVGMSHQINPAINNVYGVIVLGITPFNILKVAIDSTISYMVLKRLFIKDK